VHVITGAARVLPVDRLQDLVALQPGVVAQGEALHVRGGRAGELEVVVDGVPLNEPLRGSPMELPLVAVREAELVTGGFEAQHGGTLAGVLDVRPYLPQPRFAGELRWASDGRIDTEYDHAAARLLGPIGVGGLGFVAAAEATLDGTSYPSLRSDSRRHTVLGDFGWRDDNRLLGFLEIAPVRAAPWKLQAFTSRKVLRPYDPMWSLNAWVNFCPGDDPNCPFPPYVGPDSIPGAYHYRAADHKTITDERRHAAILTTSIGPERWRATTSLAWLGSRSITSLDGHDDDRYVAPASRPVFGSSDNATVDPFIIYAGDEPYFRRSRSDVFTVRADARHVTSRGSRIQFGLGADYQTVSSFEFDWWQPTLHGIDTIRTYHAWAPGGFAYLQGRWEFQGLVLNGGLRGQYFEPGALEGKTPYPVPDHGVLTWSPRLGLAYPLSRRDAFSLAYVRLHQDPGRDYLYDNRYVPFNRHPLGNPELEPSVVISYQAALKHLFDEEWSLQLGLFYRDVFGQVGSRQDPTRYAFLLHYDDADEGHAEGFEVSGGRRGGGGNRIELQYTYLHAWGTQSREEGVPFGTILGTRALPIGEHPLDWDQRHGLAFLGAWRPRRDLLLSWSTRLASGLPWSPARRRTLEADLSRMNSARLSWTENTAVALRFLPPWPRGLGVGMEVRNLFDWRGDIQTTVDGYPNPSINTVYDDYSAYRSETGRGGGAYWDDANGDGYRGWVPVHDPRLAGAPRTIRGSLTFEFGGGGDGAGR